MSDENIHEKKHVFHSDLRDATEQGGFAFRRGQKVSIHKKTGKAMVDIVNYHTGVQQVIWCENDGIKGVLEALEPGQAVNLKAFGVRDKAYVQLFDVDGNDVTPEPALPPNTGGFAGGGFGTAVTPPAPPAPPAQPAFPQAPATPAPAQPLFPQGQPVPEPEAPGGSVPLAKGDVQRMVEAFDDAVVLVNGVASVVHAPPMFEDYRAVAISLFIERGRGR